MSAQRQISLFDNPNEGNGTARRALRSLSLIENSPPSVFSEELYMKHIGVLDLSVRAHHALKSYGCTAIGQAIDVLREYCEAGFTRVRNFGHKGIMELDAKLSAYLIQYEGSRSSGNATDASAIALRSDPFDSDLTKRWRSLIRLVVGEVEQDRLNGVAVFDGYPLAYWLHKDITSNSKQWLKRMCQRLEHALLLQSVSDELVSLLMDIPARDLDIFMRRTLALRPTLEELGREWGLTRERIRQIERRTERRLADRISVSPCLRIQSAIAIAKEMGAEITYSAWVERITRSGLLGQWSPQANKGILSTITPADLLIAVCNLSEAGTASAHCLLPENLRCLIGHEDVTANVIKTAKQLPKATIRDIRKQAKNGGAVHIPSTSKELGLPVEETRALLLQLGYERVTDDWFMLKPHKTQEEFDRTWAVVHTVLKMLRFCGPLEIDQAARGLRRRASRQGYSVPPPAVLTQVLTRYRFVVKDGYVTWHDDNLSTASTGETIALGLVEALGPVVSHFELVQAFIEAGLSVPALSAVLRYSPLLVKVDSGLYKLRGKAVSHGDIEKARLRQPITDTNSEIKFDTSGAIHLRLNLGVCIQHIVDTQCIQHIVDMRVRRIQHIVDM